MRDTTERFGHWNKGWSWVGVGLELGWSWVGVGLELELGWRVFVDLCTVLWDESPLLILFWL
jgi:hypothetical protein